MVTRKSSEIPTHHVGIPRSHGAAQKLGYKKSKFKFADLSESSKSNFVKLADSGARAGSLCGIGPSPDAGYWLVCYKDDSGRCKWIDVPKGSPIPDHD